MSWDAKGVLEAKVSRDTRCPGQSPSWDGVGCPRTPRFVPGHLRRPRTVLSQDGQLSWDGRRRSRTALLGHQVSRDTMCPWTFFSAPERPPLTPDRRCDYRLIQSHASEIYVFMFCALWVYNYGPSASRKSQDHPGSCLWSPESSQQIY